MAFVCFAVWLVMEEDFTCWMQTILLYMNHLMVGENETAAGTVFKTNAFWDDNIVFILTCSRRIFHSRFWEHLHAPHTDSTHFPESRWQLRRPDTTTLNNEEAAALVGSAELPFCLLRGSGSIRHRRQEAGWPGLRCLKVMHRHTHERRWGNICLELWLSATVFSLLNHGDWELNQGTKWNAIRNRWDARWSLQKKILIGKLWERWGDRILLGTALKEEEMWPRSHGLRYGDRGTVTGALKAGPLSFPLIQFWSQGIWQCGTVEITQTWGLNWTWSLGVPHPVGVPWRFLQWTGQVWYSGLSRIDTGPWITGLTQGWLNNCNKWWSMK